MQILGLSLSMSFTIGASSSILLASSCTSGGRSSFAAPKKLHSPFPARACNQQAISCTRQLEPPIHAPLEPLRPQCAAGRTIHCLALVAACTLIKLRFRCTEQLLSSRPLNFCSVSMSIETQLVPRAEQRSDETSKLSPWLDELKEEALKRGVSEETVSEAFREIEPSEKIMEVDRNQPELKLTAEAYLKRMVSEYRIEKGVQAFIENNELLHEVSESFGVPATVLASIWGVESSYGSFPGSWNVFQALITLAYASPKPTRAAYFREELFHALIILDNGYGPADRSEMKGSWAGAMGQCQFMPSSYRNYAVDYDKDGRKDIWTSKADIFASMANYLVKHGWKTGGPFAQRVCLPADLDQSLCGLGVRKEVHEWLKCGVAPVGTLQLDENEAVSLVAPDGPSGVAYLVGDNFRVVMRYNTSPLYCMSVFELAREIDSRVAAAAMQEV